MTPECLVFARARRLSLSSARRIQSMLSYQKFKRPFCHYLPICDLFSQLPLSFRFLSVTSVCFLSSPHACYVRRTSHISWYENPNSIWWGVNLMKPKYATFFSLLLLPTLKLKCLPQHPNTDCPHRMFSLPWGHLNVYWRYLNVLLRVLECIGTV
jgi:hypothetical protein